MDAAHASGLAQDNGFIDEFLVAPDQYIGQYRVLDGSILGNKERRPAHTDAQ